MPEMNQIHHDYPLPGRMPRPVGVLLVIAMVAGAVLLKLHQPIGYLGAVAFVAYLVLIGVQAPRMRDEAFAELESALPDLTEAEVDRRLQRIVRVYGGWPRRRLDDRVAQIRSRASQRTSAQEPSAD